jgi:chromosome partitioning protein
MGQRVLVVDIDPQSHATNALGININDLAHSIYNVMTDAPENSAKIEKAILEIEENLHLAPSHILMTTLEQELGDKPDAVLKLHNAISEVSEFYDYIIIDCPPNLGFLTFNGLRAADMTIIPVESSSFSFRGVSRLLSMIELVKTRLHHEPEVRTLLTMFDKRTKFSRKILFEMQRRFSDNLCETRIRINIALREAADSGKTIFSYDRNSKGAQDYMSLAQEVVADVNREKINRFFKGAEELLNKCLSRDRRFSIFAPSASEVYVAGDFNEWQIDDNSRLNRNGEGKWERTFFMPPGKHRYKFFVDGNWYTDPENPVTEGNPFGGLDSVLFND